MTVVLGDYIKESKERVLNSTPPVLSVTNSSGFKAQQDYFAKSVHSKNISNYKIVKRGQFAYNPSRINVGSIDLLNNFDEGALSPMYVVFETDKELLLPEYLQYFTQTPAFTGMVKQNTAGTVRESLSFDGLSKFKLYLPTVSSQIKIIKTLEIIDKSISQTKQILMQTEQLKKGLMQHLLKVDTTEIDTVPLQSLLNGLKTGVSVGGEDREMRNDDEVGVLKISAVTYLTFDPTKYKVVYGDQLHRVTRYAKEGTILVSRANTPSLVGASVYIDTDYPNLFLPDKLWELTVKDDVSPEWLNYVLQELYSKGVAGSLATGTSNSMLNISQSKYLNLAIPAIPYDEQCSIANILMMVDSKLNIYKKIKEQQLIIRKGLLQDLLTGKVLA